MREKAIGRPGLGRDPDHGRWPGWMTHDDPSSPWQGSMLVGHDTCYMVNIMLISVQLTGPLEPGKLPVRAAAYTCPGRWWIARCPHPLMSVLDPGSLQFDPELVTAPSRTQADTLCHLMPMFRVEGPSTPPVVSAWAVWRYDHLFGLRWRGTWIQDPGSRSMEVGCKYS